MTDNEKLFKLITNPEDDEDISYVSEFGWINDKKFIVWVNYVWVQDFMNALAEIFGKEIFDDGGFDANMQSDGIAFDLCEAVGDLDVEAVFPKDVYRY